MELLLYTEEIKQPNKNKTQGLSPDAYSNAGNLLQYYSSRFFGNIYESYNDFKEVMGSVVYSDE
jgi:hypothetical protein